MAAVSASKKNEHNMSHNGKSPFKDLGKKGKVYDLQSSKPRIICGMQTNSWAYVCS